MKRLNLMLSFTLLTACSGQPSLPTEDSVSAEPTESVQQEDLPQAMPPPTPENAPLRNNKNDHLPIAEWLVQRQGICSQDRLAIDAQLQRHQQGFASDTFEKNKKAQSHSQLNALMLASCDPARTPGLLHEFLHHMMESDYWPSEYQALFALIGSQQATYAEMERRFRELEARHQKTIEGIGNIERSLESQIEPDD